MYIHIMIGTRYVCYNKPSWITFFMSENEFIFHINEKNIAHNMPTISTMTIPTRIMILY